MSRRFYILCQTPLCADKYCRTAGSIYVKAGISDSMSRLTPLFMPVYHRYENTINVVNRIDVSSYLT